MNGQLHAPTALPRYPLDAVMHNLTTTYSGRRAQYKTRDGHSSPTVPSLVRFVFIYDFDMEDQGSIPDMGIDWIFSLCRSVQTDSGAHPTCSPSEFRGQSGRGVKLTTHLQLVPRLRMRGAVHPIPQYIFIA